MFHVAIVGAYYIGTLLYPEAKTYRLLADVFFGAAIVSDVISPLLNPASVAVYFPWLSLALSTRLRAVALCFSAALRALCGLAAGGSKSALTLHFATPETGKGDVGDMSAKDASKETVLSLLGMLVRKNDIKQGSFSLTEFVIMSAWKPRCPPPDNPSFNLRRFIFASCRPSCHQLYCSSRHCFAHFESAKSRNCMDYI